MEKKKTPQQKWNQKNLKQLKWDAPNEVALEFKEALNILGIKQSDVFRKAVEDTIKKSKKKEGTNMRTIESYNELMNLISEENHTETYTSKGIVIEVKSIKYLVDKKWVNYTGHEIYLFGEEYLWSVDDELKEELKELDY